MAKVVVVGGGVAGVFAALAARRRGAETVLFEASKRVGLSRALVPFLLSGGRAEEDLVLREAALLKNEGVEVMTNEGVTSVEHRTREVKTAHGKVRFDALIICTGSRGIVPLVRGISKKNVYVMGQAADYIALSEVRGRITRAAISGPLPLALGLGEKLATQGMKAQVFAGEGGLARQFPESVARMISDAAVRKGVQIVDGGVEAILGVDRAEAVLSRGSVYPCDCAVIIPRGAPSVPATDCEKGPNGGLAVDSGMRTSLEDVFAAGDCAELRMRSSSVPARLYSASRVGGEVAGTNAAGGSSYVRLSGSIAEEYFGVGYCSAGLTKRDAVSVGIDALSVESSFSCRDRHFGEETVFTSLVYERATHRICGIQVAGWHALAWSDSASLVVSLGLTADQIAHLESAYMPGQNVGASPIYLTAAKIPSLARKLNVETQDTGLRQP